MSVMRSLMAWSRYLFCCMYSGGLYHTHNGYEYPFNGDKFMKQACSPIRIPKPFYRDYIHETTTTQRAPLKQPLIKCNPKIHVIKQVQAINFNHWIKFESGSIPKIRVRKN